MRPNPTTASLVELIQSTFQKETYNTIGSDRDERLARGGHAQREVAGELPLRLTASVTGR